MTNTCDENFDLSTLIKSCATIPTSIISDNLDRYPGFVGLTPWHGNKKLIGIARTVRTRAGDNLAVHQALNEAMPGDVLVVDGGEDVSRALVGGIMMEIAIHRGVAGFIIDGAVRDISAFKSANFPCFARAVIHRGPYKFGPGVSQVTVVIGGTSVAPGDLIIGDEDGALAVSPVVANSILSKLYSQKQREEQAVESIRNGTYVGSYGAIKN